MVNSLARAGRAGQDIKARKQENEETTTKKMPEQENLFSLYMHANSHSIRIPLKKCFTLIDSE